MHEDKDNQFTLIPSEVIYLLENLGAEQIRT